MKTETLLEDFEYVADAPNGVRRLREMILQLAVEGKLVPQDPNDGPASVLLERCKNERERLVKEKKMGLVKQLSAVHQERLPYQVPKGWLWARFGEIGRIVGGGTPDTKKHDYFTKDGIPWLTPADLYNLNDKYIGRGKRDISELGLKKSSAQLLPEGTILFSSRAPIGYVAIASNEVTTNQGFKSCVPFVLEMNQYIYYFLKHAGQEIDRKASGTTFKEVSGKEVNQILIPIPPLAEQKRIVAKVDQLMALCDELEGKQQKKSKACINLNTIALEKLLVSQTVDEFEKHWHRIYNHFDLLYSPTGNVATTAGRGRSSDTICCGTKNLQQLRQTILQLAVQGRLVRQDSNDEPASVLLDKIKIDKERLIKNGTLNKSYKNNNIDDKMSAVIEPMGWLLTRFGDVINLISGQHIEQKDYNNNADGTPYLTGPADFGVKFPIISKWTTKPKVIANKNDILITVKGSGVGKINLNNIDNVAISRQLMAIRPILISTEYVFIFLMSKLSFFQGRKTGIAIPGIDRDDILNIHFSLPPLAEQKRIATRVDQLITLFDLLEQKLNKAHNGSSKLVEAVVKGFAGTKTTKKEEGTRMDKKELRVEIKLNKIMKEKDMAKTILAKILSDHNGEIYAKELWRQSNLSIDDFYSQLKQEIEQGYIENPNPGKMVSLKEAV